MSRRPGDAQRSKHIERLGRTPKGAYGTQRSKKGSEKALERVLGKGSQKGSEKGVCCGFYSKKGVLRRGSQKGF